MDGWYKNAFFYGIQVSTFKDGNNDGIGDFIGLTQKLDYLLSLGVDCIWLLPFFPSGGRDDGYDVTDYMAIDPLFGTLPDFEKFVKEAAKRKIRVIIDLVMHHTSSLHPWFLSAQKGKDPFHSYYIFTDRLEEKDYEKPAFPGIDPGVWSYSPLAHAFYYHRFYRVEPDLNLSRPRVQKEMETIMDFWLAFGISGFRVDAATMLTDKRGIPNTDIVDPGVFLAKLRSFVTSRNANAIILAEADVGADKVATYFGKGDRMQLLYSFLLNRYLFLGFAKHDAAPIKTFLKKIPKPPPQAQWLNFLRNHDELNISQLPEKDREAVFQAFGPEQGMQVYGRGIRRRLAPMLRGDPRRIKMALSLLFALPGAPLILYGDEIGLGDDLQLPERLSVRIPMQWSGEKNGGFSRVNPAALYRNVLNDGPYRYEKVNVADQLTDEGSILNHVKHLAIVRKFHPEIGHGLYRILDVSPDSAIAFSFEYHDRTLIALHNVSPKGCKAVFNNVQFTTLEELFSDGEYFREEKPTSVSLNGYGYRWFYGKTEGREKSENEGE